MERVCNFAAIIRTNTETCYCPNKFTPLVVDLTGSLMLEDLNIR